MFDEVVSVIQDKENNILVEVTAMYIKCSLARQTLNIKGLHGNAQYNAESCRSCLRLFVHISNVIN